jgi:hypothetical protein
MIYQKKTSKKAKNRQFRLEFFFFQKKSTKESKLVFPTNLTILYPNPQKKNFMFYLKILTFLRFSCSAYAFT